MLSINIQTVIYTIFFLSLSVGVRKLQVAILARSSREISLTVRMVWQYILSRVCVSVRPSIFLYEKNTQNLGETGPPVPVFISMASDQLLSPAERSGPSRLAGTDPSNSDTATAVCVCVGGVCALIRAGACARVCVRSCVRDVFATYDNNIWPMLIMIIINNIIL